MIHSSRGYLARYIARYSINTSNRESLLYKGVASFEGFAYSGSQFLSNQISLCGCVPSFAVRGDGEGLEVLEEQGAEKREARFESPSIKAMEEIGTLSNKNEPRSPAPVGISKTFYKRHLPCPPAVAFSSEEGQKIFSGALASGTMRSFFQLIEHFRTQDEPAFCGLASVAMVLNALSVDPRRPWKGNWRYFSEGMLDCCTSLSKVKEEGITLDEAACLAHCNGASVNVYRYGSVSLKEFRSMIKEAVSGKSPSPSHIIVSYSRQAFNQTGSGHFSPLAGLSEEHDMVLILDTARFKYPPHWVKLEELYHAMKPIDPTTGVSRGFITLSSTLLESALFTLDVREEENVMTVLHYLENGASAVTSKKNSNTLKQCNNVKDALKSLIESLPLHAIQRVFAVRTIGKRCKDGVCTQVSVIETFLLEIRAMDLYNLVYKICINDDYIPQSAGHFEDMVNFRPKDSTINLTTEADKVNTELLPSSRETQFLVEKICLALLLTESSWDWHDSEDINRELKKLLDISGPLQQVVAHEVSYLRHQFEAIKLRRVESSIKTVDCACSG